MPNLFFMIVGGKKRPKLSAGGIILWFGTEGDIPAPFSLYASAASTFIMGAAAMGKDTTPSGAATHVHTVPTTNPNGSHSHSWSTTSGAAASTQTYLQSIGNSVSNYGHSHSLGDLSSSQADHSHPTENTGSEDSRPPYVRLYYIRQTAVVEDFPVGSVIMLAVEPTEMGEGWQLCNGLNGTPDLRGKFVYAASIDGEVGSTGGKDSHGHTNPDAGGAGGHTHVIAGVSSEDATYASNKAPSYGDVHLADTGHTHSFSKTTGTDADHSHTIGSAGSASVLPPFKNLYYVMRIA